MMRSSENVSTAAQVAGSAGAQILVTQGSLALKMLTQNLRDNKKYSVLDLGPAVKENVDFYSSFANRIQIEDLYDSLNLAAASVLNDEAAGHNANDQNFEHTLPYTKDTRFDLIFAWDIFNYLTREQLQKMIAHLSRFCNRRAMLFSLTANSQYVPEHPIGFKILDQENLIHPAIVSGGRINTRYKEPNLARLMPSFNVDKTFLLRNGMQEHLFILNQE